MNQILGQADSKSNQPLSDKDTTSYSFQKNEPLIHVEENPIFLGNFENFIKLNLTYPELARKKKIQGRVTLFFTVRKDSTVADIQVLSGIYPECDKEAIRLIKLMDKLWKPGLVASKNVDSKIVKVVWFKLAEK